MSGQGPGSEVWAAKHLRLAVEAAGVALWSWHVFSNRLTMDERAFDLWGLAWASEVQFEKLSERIHPADQDRVRLAFEATRATEGPFEIDFRIEVDGSIRWVSARGQGGDEAIVDSTMFGIFLDVTERKQVEESNELLAGEMSHRVKNLLSIAMGLTNITYRSASTTQDMASGLTQRLMALGRAHDLVRPGPDTDGRAAALLGDLIAVLLSPYDEDNTPERRIRVAVGRHAIGESAATTLAMVIHELATNAVKHGSLSGDHGTLEVKTSEDSNMVRLIWAECGGPPIDAPPTVHGFGDRKIVV